jgi:Polyketide cyclase / dehydrase and lipid transport
MKILKWVLIVIGILIAIPLLIALFLPKDYSVSREVIINKPKDQVFAYVKSLKNQNNWATWNQMDPNQKNEYRGEDGTPGFVHRWEGNPDNVGTGEQEIVKVTEGERVDFELRFEVPFESKSPAWITAEAASDNQTKVTWGMSGTMPYPMNFMQVFMNMEDMIGTEYEKSLANLKGIIEAQ